MVNRRLDVGRADYHPAYVVWELTLACDQPCTHCGSRAGTARPGELSTEEALGVVTQLAALRAREVVLIGGEAYLHPGFLDIIQALKAAGIRPGLTTGGRGITAELAVRMAQAGLYAASVSIDGLEPTHDIMRAARGSFASATAALGFLKAAGVRTAANTNLNRLNQGDLEGLYAHLRTQGIGAWQVQITAPLGRAADRPDLLLQPWDLVDLMPRIDRLKLHARQDRIIVMPGNNLGYFGPEEGRLRSVHADGRDHWRGCQAGRYVMGIESNGAVKGCPSLQTAHYVGGNLREQPLERIWNDTPQLAFTRTRTVEDLWGFCRTCPFAQTCMAGCSFTAHALFGRPGNNPYCHYRAKARAAQGVRERLLPRAPAPGRPFDNGLFEIVEEPLDAPDPKPELKREYVKTKRWPRPEA
ncbi:SPASM domain-containing protein [Corallococcus sp. CA047B]|uniref:radical SAM/SPASM domain-containing protein n=1 Tax=Corallococcus sp. CA047B TaxID=2316729 RepID=UPI000EA1B646|nr:radical SAM protein [Corallococcus sp. CA047B]RKH07598.1 SPASM domain-containing protein [Corallococcus sp. CA047B]